MTLAVRAIGTPLDRLDGPEKVTGTARYAFEQPVHDPAYVYPLQSTVAAGRIVDVDDEEARALPGVLAVLTHRNAARVASTDDPEIAILQTDEVTFRGQCVGAVVAETSEIARHAAALVRIAYRSVPHDVELRLDHPDRYVPETTNGGFPSETERGDPEAALATAAVRHEAVYTTPRYHHNPIETHSTVALWADGHLTLHVGSQGVHRLRTVIATLFGLDPERIRIVSPHVGGAFGSKLHAHADTSLAVLAAMAVPGRPVRLALTRQQMFSQVGYRTPTIQRIQLGADRDGRLVAITHVAAQQTARNKEFTEQTATPSRVMYAAPHRRTRHFTVRLDVPPPTIMRAPGETPGMYALESAMDEMAIACGRDPVEFRIANEPELDPEKDRPFSSRNLVACLREGARRFGWEGRDPTPRARRVAGWLVGTGVAASVYPVYRLPGSSATIRLGPDGRYEVLIGAADMGTGTWTALTQIAADALGVPMDRVTLRIGDTALPEAVSAGGSTGMNSWGSAVVEAARRLRMRLAEEYGGTVPPAGIEASAGMPENPQTGASRCTPSAPSSPRCGSTRRPGRSGCPGCSGSSPPGGSSIRRRAAPNCSAGWSRDCRWHCSSGPWSIPASDTWSTTTSPSTRSRPTPTSARSRCTCFPSTTRTSTRWVPRGSASWASSVPRRRSPTPRTTPRGSGCATFR